MDACYIFACQQLLDWLPIYSRENPYDTLVRDLWGLTNYLCGGQFPNDLLPNNPDILNKKVKDTLSALSEGGWGEGTDEFVLPRRVASIAILKFAWELYSQVDAWSYEADHLEKMDAAMTRARNSIIEAGFR